MNRYQWINPMTKFSFIYDERPFVEMDDIELSDTIVGCLLDRNEEGDPVLSDMSHSTAYVFDLLMYERVLRN